MTDAATKQPVADVVVTATSPNLQGEQVVVTDATGLYRIPQLPPGTYTLRLEKEAYKPYSRSGITLRVDTTTRLNAEILPEALKGEDIVVVGRAPTVDVGSTTTGVNVSSDFIRNIAVVAPGGRGSAARSFESLAVVAPGAQSDTYGVSVSGTTSLENQYVIDGLSVNDPGFGFNATPLSVDFVQEVNVITGGYMPEYGRATGGIMNVVTKSGSNEFHGSVWGDLTPGAHPLAGNPTTVLRAGSTVSTVYNLWNQGDFGAELGGPILKDKLWFFVGVAPSFTRYQLTRNLNQTQIDPNTGQPVVDPNTGFIQTQVIPGTTQQFFADERSVQYIGKLTYLINQDHNLSLSVYGTPTTSGGSHSFGVDPSQGIPEVTNMVGAFPTLAHIYNNNSTDVSLKLASSFLDKRVLLDATLGWHHQTADILPTDGSDVGSSSGLAGLPQVIWRRSITGAGDPNFHTIGDFETLSPSAAAYCDAPGSPGVLCPLTQYRTGGPGFLGHDILDRYEGRAVVTYLLNALGHHVLKAGADIESASFHRIKAYSGTVLYRESTSGSRFQDYREYGYLVGPDQPYISPTWDATSKSTTVGGFVQDSWNLLDLVTVNAGVRYDTQTMWGNDNKVALIFPNQVSPRIGVVYDFTQQGRSKIFANYARFYENALLDMIDREFPGERQLTGAHFRTTAGGSRPGCNALDQSQLTDPNHCRSPADLVPGIYNNGDVDPNSYYGITGGDKSPVDPNLQAQSSDEIVVGGEYEIFTDARLGASYTKRYMVREVDDMSRDAATTYFIGNPGYGIASDIVPAADGGKAVRNYDAVTVYLNKSFSDGWLAQGSYTYARLVGNFSGLFRPETNQLDPNIGSDFDLKELVANHLGPLPGNHTPQIKVYGSKEFVLSGATSLNIGVTYLGRSGSPLNYWGSHPIYGADEIFILPRGSAGETPWVHEIDAHVGFNLKLSKDSIVTLGIDAFNLFNFQATTLQDQRYTNDDVNPLQPQDCGGRACTPADLGKVTLFGSTDPLPAADKNPNFLHPTQYQAPRTVRFSARVTF